MSNEDIDIAIRAARNLEYKSNGEKQQVIEKAMRLYLNDQISDADNEILKLQGNSV